LECDGVERVLEEWNEEKVKCDAVEGRYNSEWLN
jgi:hypothetical protein